MMYLTIYVPFMLIIKTTSHIPKNDSSIVIYGGHADADRDFIPIARRGDPTTVPPRITTNPPPAPEIRTTTEPVNLKVDHHEEHDDGQVVFIPTQPFEVRNVDDDFLHDDTLKLDEIIQGKKGFGLKDIKEATTTPKSDILFVQGRNAEIDPEEENQKRKISNSETHEDAKTRTEAPIKLDCRNLDCDRHVNSLCGVKVENGHLRYRLFMNECFYRKVNCAFSYESNRYKIVSIEKCSSVGGHYTQRSDFMYQQPIPYNLPPKNYETKPSSGENSGTDLNKILETRRQLSGRRAMQINMDGKYCAHTCPTSCTEDYQPECAMNSLFERRVFLNHCKLDWNSCTYGMVWRRRPLSECVGGKKAEMQQNRAFIGWMQRVGIVDKKGRLVLN